MSHLRFFNKKKGNMLVLYFKSCIFAFVYTLVNYKRLSRIQNIRLINTSNVSCQKITD